MKKVFRNTVRVVRSLGAHDGPIITRKAALLHLLSEYESLVFRPGAKVRFRRAFLRCRGIYFEQPIFIGARFALYKSPDSRLEIGPRCCIGEHSGIYVHGPMRIGADFVAAPGLTINNGSHDIETMKPRASELRIGDRVWCGINVSIIAGAEIGNDCVIGAGSLVRDKIPDGSVVVGSPAKIIKTGIRSESNLPFWSPFKERTPDSSEPSDFIAS